MAHVLVVDDDATIRRLLTFAFTLEGHTVETLTDGMLVVETLRAAGERVVVFMDLMMPCVDGWTVAAQLQAEPELLARHAIVIMSAALSSAAPPPDCARDTLPKPFDLNRALRLVERLADEAPQVLAPVEPQVARSA
jgi:CheY-like chemotaxis protein